MHIKYNLLYINESEKELYVMQGMYLIQGWSYEYKSSYITF